MTAKRYLIVTEEYDLFHTDDKELACDAAGPFKVWDTETMKGLNEDGSAIDDEQIKEYTV